MNKCSKSWSFGGIVNFPEMGMNKLSTVGSFLLDLCLFFGKGMNIFSNLGGHLEGLKK